MVLEDGKLYEVVYCCKSKTVVYESLFYRIIMVENSIFSKITNVTGISQGKILVSSEVIIRLISNNNYQKGDEVEFLYPLNLCALVTNECNQECRYCCYSRVNLNSKEKIEANADILAQRINEAVETGFIFISGGEPFLYDHMYDFLNMIETDNKIVSINTNGTIISRLGNRMIDLLKQKQITLNISFDSADASVHNLMRANCNVVKDTIRFLCDAGVNVRINSVITKANLNDLSGLAEYLLTTGVRQWSLINIIGVTQSSQFKPPSEDVKRAIWQLFRDYHNGIYITYRDEISVPYSLFQINPDGGIVSPSSNANNPISYGNISDISVLDAWNGGFEKVSHFSRYMLASYPFHVFYN